MKRTCWPVETAGAARAQPSGAVPPQVLVGVAGASGRPSGPASRCKVAAFYCVLAGLVPATGAAAEPHLFADSLRTLEATCMAATPDELARQSRAELASSSAIVVNGLNVGWRATLKTENAGRFELQRLSPAEHFQGVRLEWWGAGVPVLFVSADASCRVQAARRIEYDGNGRPEKVVHLDGHLRDTPVQDPLNPPVPPGEDPGGVRVAMVDSGVNYLLESIRRRLARDAAGELVGFDFWDMDRRPFDANPARSPFFVQRHGTRTASLLLEEAPQAALVPYRYPRPEMSRMGDLVRRAAANGVRIVGMPLGSNHESDWAAFHRAARELPQILFIVSAGNSGRDIDQVPSYPASLSLDNMLVVTSADDSGLPAAGSNWGARTVDILVPAENRMVTGFDGGAREASGSSYAVSRIVALAARLARHQPEWRAPELKAAVFGLTLARGFEDFVSVGYLPDPLADTAEVALIADETRTAESDEDRGALHLDLSVALLAGSGWRAAVVDGLTASLDSIFNQCGIALSQLRLVTLQVPGRLLDLDVGASHTLVTGAGLTKPTVYLVRDTLRRPAYEGEAFGRSNSGHRPWLVDTVWLTAGARNPEVGLAHELFHVLSDSGAHVEQPGNLMQARTEAAATTLTASQCERARATGVANGLLRR